MVDIVANPEWKSVRILERDEVALGGYGGNMNEQATALVARTEFLMQEKANTSDIIQGQYSFSTLAEFDSKKATIPANSVVIIDEAGANQGANTWDGTTLTKSAYDPLTQAKLDATTKADAAKNEAIVAASIDATTKANAAEANAKTYADEKDFALKTQIEAIAKMEANKQSKIELDAFFGDYQSGLLIDVSQESDYQVLSVENGVKAYSSIDEFYPTAFNLPRIVVNKDKKLVWCNHNTFVRTDDLTVSSWVKTGLTVAKNQKSVTGNTSAFLLTTTAVTANIKQNVVGFNTNREVTVSAVVKPLVSVTHAYLALSGSNVIFDLNAKTVVSAGTAYNASITSLSDGYFRLSASFNGGATPSVAVGLSDNSSVIATKTGLSAIVEQFQLNLGGLTQNYTENKTTTMRVLAPIDYSRGERTLLIETTRNYRGLYSEDLSQLDWVKTNATASMAAVSPILTPCSRLTATSNDATALQTIPQTALVMSAFIKRNVGSGAVYMTLNGGTTWQDITSKISASDYSRVLISGSGTSYGFKLETSGDSIDVCFVNAIDSVSVPSPFPVYAVASPFAANLDNIPEIPLSGEVTAYVKAHQSDFVGTQNFFQPVRFGAVDGAIFVPHSSSSGSGNAVATIRESSAVALVTRTNALASLWKTVEVTALASKPSNRYELSVNGEHALPLVRLGSPALTYAKLGVASSGSYYLNKSLIVKEAVKDYDIRNWRFSKKQYNEGLVNVCTVTKDGQFTGTETMREPIVFVLSDDNEAVDFLIIHLNKYANGYFVEGPARLIQRKIRYIKSSNSFNYLTDSQVFYAHEGWSQDKGHLQSPCVTRINSGVNAGRLVALFTKADSDDLSLRNTYRTFNDRNGDADAWTTPEKVIDSQDSFGGVGVAVLCPDGAILTLPSNHKTNPNRIISAVYNGGWFSAVYSDDDGVTWASSSKVTTANSTEPTMCYLPSGDILLSLRNETVGIRNQYKSSDGGVTWVSAGNMVNFVGAVVAGSVAQLDPTGVNSLEKPNGKPVLVVSGYDAGVARTGLSVNMIDQDLKTITSRKFYINERNYVGYLSAKPILNNEYLAVAFEGGDYIKAQFNRDNSSYLAIVKV